MLTISDLGTVCLSFIIGILIGLTSMGGAALMTPFLMLILGVRPIVAVGTDLVYGALTKLAGAVIHWRQGTVDVRVVSRLALGSVPGGVAGVVAIQFLHLRNFDVDAYIRHAIGVALIIVAAVLLHRAVWGQTSTTPRVIRENARVITVSCGAVVGFVVGLTSIGSGSLIAPFLMLLFPSAPARAVGTDVFHAAVLVLVTGGLHASGGTVEWRLVPLLLLGSLPGVILGSVLAPRLPTRPLRVGLSLMLFATGTMLV